ncbi:bleomycin resistance protein [Epibacterium ulvae]|uniref:bleomycin resistance protein n=1 Tax=Epibacterium ulvae TaxID=1156985 RepID=UPI001BFC768C|nr:bleomycin resistance protein [Epibacterium ulvae]MBT8152968.1 bleomycin resistance protein [Epibacterium ulvae]
MTGAQITANLPSRDFDRTEAFYHRLGFATAYRDGNWMILTYGDTQVEFFPHPDLAPADSWFSACLRVADITPLYARWSKLGLATDAPAAPRLGDVIPVRGTVPRMFPLIDPDGTLWRVIDLKGLG